MTAPRRVSDRVLGVSLDGCIVPTYADGQPYLLSMPDTTDWFVPVFSTLERLRQLEKEPKVGPFPKLNRIDDGKEFTRCLLLENGHLPYRLRIALDIRIVASGKWRFEEVTLPEMDLPAFEPESQS